MHVIYDIGNTHWSLDLSFHSCYNRLFLSTSSSANLKLHVFLEEECFLISNSLKNSTNSSFDYIEFDETVYSCCWDKIDQWLFASVSFSGTIHINRVPEEVKFKVMVS